MPARKKPAGTRQDNRPQRQGLSIVSTSATPQIVDVPPLPSMGTKTHPSTQLVWTAFWESQSAEAAQEVDMVVAERWIFAYDEWRKSILAVRKQRLVTGSQGQPVINPLAAWAKSQADEMRRCEESLGIGPKQRANLGYDFGRAQLTAADLNRLTEEDDADSAINADEADLLAEFNEDAGGA